MPFDPAHPPDRYVRLRDGFLFASRRLSPAITVRPSAVLLLSACGRPFGLEACGMRLDVQAAAVQPMVARRLSAAHCDLVSLNIHPTHDDFLRWRALGWPGVRPLPRSWFAAHDAALRALFPPHEAELGAVQRLAGELLQAMWSMLPPAAADSQATDPLRATLLQWLRAHPDAGLREMAAALGLSYHRMSVRFTQAMGLSFRQWQVFARAQRAVLHLKQPSTLTGIAHEAGYTDSAHLARSWHRAYGLSPSRVRSDNSVQAIW